ncbi:MAG TPA: imidazole glycerol phosphate synthase subunit HisF [Firmicutes bacterium]|jgi:cyclase|nr:imidazole glycerol phosphate synthase subunit HisF [Bacillota bacterium]
MVSVTTKRLIACLDLKHDQVVKGVRFQQLQTSGDPLTLAKAYASQGVDELVCLAIAGTTERKTIAAEIVRQIVQATDIPLAVGGGLSSLELIEQVLAWGADKVVVSTATISNPQLIEQAAAAVGSRRVVLAIDAKNTGSGWEVYSHGGRQATGLDAVDWAQKGAELGAGEILLTSIDQDGTQDGYDLSLLRSVCSSIHIPVIASGGAGRPEHLFQALTAGADAVLVASMLHKGAWTAAELKDFLRTKGVEI